MMAVKGHFDWTASKSRLNSALEKGRETMWECFIVNHIIPSRYIYNFVPKTYAQVCI